MEKEWKKKNENENSPIMLDGQFAKED